MDIGWRQGSVFISILSVFQTKLYEIKYKNWNQSQFWFYSMDSVKEIALYDILLDRNNLFYNLLGFRRKVWAKDEPTRQQEILYIEFL